MGTFYSVAVNCMIIHSEVSSQRSCAMI